MTSLGQASAALALGSSFFHASHTRLGQKADGLLIGVMSLIMHQASLSGLPEALKTPELVDLGPSRRSRTGVQIAQVTDWQQARRQDLTVLPPGRDRHVLVPAPHPVEGDSGSYRPAKV